MTQHPFDEHRESYLAWLEARPAMLASNQDMRLLGQMLLAEVHELIEAVESGDLDNLAGEIADVFNFTLVMAWLQGVDVIPIARAKTTRNELKYPVELFDGSIEYSEAVKIARDRWDMRGDDNI